MREKDLLFEAVLRVAGWSESELTDSARGRTNRALKELRAVGATPEEVLIRGRRYWKKYPNFASRRPAPWTLASHWPGLVEAGPMGAPVVPEGPCEHLFSDMDDGDERGRYCPRCKSWQPHAVQLKLIDGEMA